MLRAQALAVKIGVPELDALDAAVDTLEAFQARLACHHPCKACAWCRTLVHLLASCYPACQLQDGDITGAQQCVRVYDVQAARELACTPCWHCLGLPQGCSDNVCHPSRHADSRYSLSGSHITMVCWCPQARCRELSASVRPALADLEALAADAEDLPGIVLEYEPLSRCGPNPSCGNSAQACSLGQCQATGSPTKQ